MHVAWWADCLCCLLCVYFGDECLVFWLMWWFGICCFGVGYLVLLLVGLLVCLAFAGGFADYVCLFCLVDWCLRGLGFIW